MLEKITGLPPGVVGYEAKGEVTRDDYEHVLDPAVAAVLEEYDKVRFLYVLGEDFTGFSGGAMWEDSKLGMGHVTRWERLAVVTDEDWIRHAVNTFGYLIPAKVKVFAVAERPEARAWVSEA